MQHRRRIRLLRRFVLGLAVAALVPYNFFASFAFGAAVAPRPGQLKIAIGAALLVVAGLTFYLMAPTANSQTVAADRVTVSTVERGTLPPSAATRKPSSKS